MDRKHTGNVREVARLLKAWKYKHSVSVSSFYLEMRAAEQGKNNETMFSLTAVRSIVTTLLNQGLPAMNDPTRLVSRISACSSESARSSAIADLRKFKKHIDAACDAWLANERYDMNQALQAIWEATSPIATRRPCLMSGHTHEPIWVAQNTARAQRMLAAQSRLYTDAKHLHDTRVLTVVVLAIATVIVALALSDARTAVGTIGGAVTFFWSVLGSAREKWRRRQAAFVQEEFDTYVFNIPWNSMAAEHPSPTVIADAANRYRGNRTEDWYPDTAPVARPLDILICQRSNLGWGAAVHRLYAAILAGLLVVLLLAGIAVALIGDLTVASALTTLLVPLLGPARELVEMIRNNRDSADTKTTAEAKVHGLWERGLEPGTQLTIDDCRAVQDKILNIRMTNAHVPDWLDNLRRDRNEALMQQSAAHLIEEAVHHGKTR